MLNKVLLILLTINCSLITLNAQWVQMPNGMGNDRFVVTLASNGNTILAGTDEWPYSSLYKSTNNGTIWTQTAYNPANGAVSSLAVNGDNVFAGLYYNGVYLSTDNGTTWTQTSLNNQTVVALAINGNYIFAGTYNSLFLSTNNGTSWTQTSLNNRTVTALAINGNIVFAGTYDYVNPYGAYKSTDNGTTWTQTSLNNRNVRSLAVNGNNVFAGTYNPDNGVYLSTDDGTTWTQTSLNNGSVYALAVNGNNIFAGTLGYGVYVSIDNGATWAQRNEGLGNLNVRALCLSNNYIFAGTYGNSVYRRPLGELVGILHTSNEIPETFRLEQNYPNPFNPTTKIKFSIPQNPVGQTFLSVYDILGREVATLVNEQLNAGAYEVDWDASNYPSGVYFYKLQSVEYTETKKMILVK